MPLPLGVAAAGGAAAAAGQLASRRAIFGSHKGLHLLALRRHTGRQTKQEQQDCCQRRLGPSPPRPGPTKRLHSAAGVLNTQI